MEPNDRLIRSLYALAVEQDWAGFRPLALERVCGGLSARAAVWSTQAGDRVTGEFSAWPAGAPLTAEQLQGLALREDGETAVSGAGRGGVALILRHQDSRLVSRLALWFNGARPAVDDLRRVLAHLVEAGALTLQHAIQSDERLTRLGRANRGSAAMVDARGTVYAASRAFRDLLGTEFGDTAFDQLPFDLPSSGEERGGFGSGTLRFRMAPAGGGRYLIYARKVQALDGLSPREQEITRALAAGKTLKSVARQYGIATSTVANHASRIYRKLGIYRREELFDLVRGPRRPSKSGSHAA